MENEVPLAFPILHAGKNIGGLALLLKTHTAEITIWLKLMFSDWRSFKQTRNPKR